MALMCSPTWRSPTWPSLICAAAVLALPAAAAAGDATADLETPDGTAAGSVTFSETESGLVLIVVAVEGLPPGVHGIHIHETGACEPPGFDSAGGHLADGRDHGVMADTGPHPGDLPNLHVGGDGSVTVEHFTDRISLDPDGEATLFDDDGSAVVIHAGADDYASQPSGESGDRIACGVIEAE